MQVRLCFRVMLGLALLFLAPNANARVLIIADVTLIDGTGAPASAHTWLKIENGRIAKISRASIRIAGAEIVDGKGKFLIPGLIDIHVHLKGGGAWGDKPTPDFEIGERALQSYLAHGVTTIFDAGNAPDYIYKLRERERAGKIVSPRIFATGQVFSSSQLRGQGQNANALPDWSEITSRLDRILARGPDVQKFSFERFGPASGEIIPAAPLETLGKIIAYARSKNVRTTIHITEETIAQTVVNAGMSTLEHPVVTTSMSDKFIAQLVKSKVVMATTFSIFDDTEGMGWPAWSKPMRAIAMANVKKLVERGGIVALGSDHFEPAMVHHEVEMIAQTGLSPTTVLRIATLNGAIFLNQQGEFGSLERGKWADMVLLDVDPLLDWRNLKRISAVFKAGQRIQP